MISSISEITQLWNRALTKIEQRLGEKQVFDSFFSETYIFEIKGDVIVVAVNSSLAATLLQGKYYSIISDVVNELTESNFKLEFVPEKDLKVSDVQSIAAPTQKQKFFADSEIKSALTFDNFVVGSFNREASQASLMIASNPGKMFNPLFIYSSSGLGKTHLMHAIGNYIQNVSKPGAKILYVSGFDFVEEYIKSVRGEKDAQLLKDYICDFDVLLLDDVQMLANKVKTQDYFFTVYEKLMNAGKQIVITSDRQPIEIAELQERLVTRFSRGLIVKINEPDQNTCVEILRKKIIANGLSVDRFDDAVLYFLADKFSQNLRELEGTLNRLIFYTLSVKHTDHITLDVAAESLQSIIGGKNIASELSEQKIINVVADYYNLSPSQLTGKIRTGQIALARHIAMYLIRITLIDVSLEKIGMAFGGKDHTTVMNAIQKVDKGLKTDPSLKEAVDELQKRLKP
ncbi:MAG: chromosomal replication initiator protein DnaA [Bacilli bacterium]|nr:chromosomal replication initiator protein DnaA [Bacilli bacterium]